ncbi:MAG TPA: hypothetical protein IAB59_01285 [Candidatus Onthousia faecipullorum]|uniref:Uncharacterized protein n=1 Tax=Candidatus Onthousia faecipullorum TaxID=2840887 RepID=A0A9D1GAB5_9FIRM|nr:hypothetical protein [Candidatus Onthousia faecipullorum]
MKKLKILLLVVLIGVTSYLGTFSSTLNVDAANNECDENYTLKTYINNLGYSISGNTVSYTGAKGLLYSTSFDSTINAADPDGNFSFVVPDENLADRIEVHFYLAQDDGVCETNKEIGSNTFYIDSTGPNQLYNDALCVNYRNRWSNNETMRNAVPYCFTETVSIQYSYNDVSSWIRDAESLYQVSQGGSTIQADPTYQNVDDVTNVPKLTCDAFSNNNYQNIHKYSHKESKTVNNCTTTCVEEIEVNFSDPQAVEPGMCFQYLIEIKSKVSCDNTYTAPRPSRKGVCYMIPYCRSSNGFESTKGGPNEDFDACVLECDGGEYSQSCIDSCYNKVYKQGKTYSKQNVKRQNAFSTINNASMLTFSSFPSNSGALAAVQVANGCIADNVIANLDANNPNDVNRLYNLKQQYPGGSYENDRWVASGTCPSSIGYYYFSTTERTRATILELQGNYYDQDGQKKYAPNNNGFLMRIAFNGAANTCTDVCYWTNNCGSNTVLTPALVEDDYQKELAEWERNKVACEQDVSTCSNETTNYKIVVDNVDSNDEYNSDSKDENNDWRKTYSASQKLNSNKITGAFPDMVTLATGKCEDKNSSSNGWDYHNIITFPGIWINNKTGQTVHSIEPGFEDYYTYAGNEYCTKLNSLPVNTAWWYWKVSQNGDPNALTSSQKQAINNSLEMNIRGHIDNYGYFGWNFDVECFYAVDSPKNSSCPPSDPNYPNCDSGDVDGCPPTDPDYPYCDCPPSDPDYPYCKSGDDDDPLVTDFTFRPVSLDTMFPNGGSASQTSVDDKDIQASNLINDLESLRNSGTSLEPVVSATRDPGFNWSCAATNLENPDYIIQPVTVMNKIQELGDSVYDGDRYLDYHIRLTPETMNKVRAYNNEYDSYTEPSDMSELLSAGNNKTAGITVYRSYLLHKVLNSSELLKSGLIGCNNEDNGSCTNVIDTSTSCYNEYMAQSAVLKGGN